MKIKAAPARSITLEQYLAEGEQKFGPDRMNWRFVCPSCGHVASAAEYKAAGAPEGAIGFSCIGRWVGAKIDAFEKGEGPCNYAGGGLFNINPVEITGRSKPFFFFEFAEVEAIQNES